MATFRQWLVDKVRATAHAREPLNEKQILIRASELGVQPSVLQEARAAYRKQAMRDGVRIGEGRKRRGTRHWQCKLHFPEEVYEVWKQECSARGVDGSALFRSLLPRTFAEATSRTPCSTTGSGRDGASRSPKDSSNARWPPMERAAPLNYGRRRRGARRQRSCADS